MKKKFIAPFFIVAALMLIVSQVSFAQDMKGRLGIGARVSYVDFSDDDYTVYGVKVDVEPDEDIMYEGNLTYFIQDYLSLELSVGYTETDVDFDALGMEVDAGDFETIPVLLSLRAHLSTNTKVSPYLLFGIGYFFNDFDQNDPVVEFIYGAGADIDVDDSFGFHVGGGVEVFVTENVALNLDLKYIWTKVEADVNIPGFKDEDIDMDSFVAGLGIKFYF